MATNLFPTPNISELARVHGISRATVRRRLASGWIPPAVIEGVANEIVEQNQEVATGHEEMAAPDGQGGREATVARVTRPNGQVRNAVRLPVATAPMARRTVQKIAPATSPKTPTVYLDTDSHTPPAPPYERTHGSRWRATGRVSVGLAIVSTGAWIAYTSMRGNAWFGHSLTPDPTAGEIYSNLSVAAELMACLIPTAIRFYWTNGEPWTAVRGWALMAVALVVVFFAAGGFAITNINSGVEVRAERENPAIRDLRNQLAGLERSIASECVKRGDRCRDLERQRADVNAKLSIERASIKTDADPQAAALGVSSATLHLIQGGAMVALCLFSGLFISFGAGLVFPRRTA